MNKILKFSLCLLFLFPMLSGCSGASDLADQFLSQKSDVPKFPDGWGSYGTISWNYHGDSGLLEIEGTGPIEMNESDIHYEWDDFKTGVTELKISEGITRVGSEAFYNCVNLKKFEFPTTLTSIGYLGFGKCGFEEISIPSTITEMEAYAFGSNNKLRHATVDAKVLGYGMFDGCDNLETCILTDNVVEIGTSAFEKSGLKEIDIPSSVKSIGENAFFCTKLKTLYIPSTVEQVYGGIADLCDHLVAVEVDRDCDYHMLFLCENMSICKLGNNCTKIEESSLSSCRELGYLWVGDNVTQIDDSAFPDGHVIHVYCHKNSEMWKICGKNANLDFKDIDDPENVKEFEKMWDKYTK